MKQYRYTSENFVHQGETGDADAVMDAQDLYQIKKLAGLVTEGGGGALAGIPATPHASEDGIQSPVGSNISYTANDRRQLEAEYNARPGTDLWFIINFTKPFLNGSLRDHVERYLNDHPEYQQKKLPGEQ
jgi:hypothetical protein